MTKDIVISLTNKFEKHPSSRLGQQLLDAIKLVNLHTPDAFRRATIHELQHAILLLKKQERQVDLT